MAVIYGLIDPNTLFNYEIVIRIFIMYYPSTDFVGKKLGYILRSTARSFHDVVN